MVSIFLHCVSSKEKGVRVGTSFAFSILTPTETPQHPNPYAPKAPKRPTNEITNVAPAFKFAHVFDGNSSTSGMPNYALRSDVVGKYLAGGALVVEFQISVALEQNSWYSQIPVETADVTEKEAKAKDPLSADMLKLLDAADENNSDVTFQVCDGNGETKQAFSAHRLILSARCPTLNASVENHGGSGSAILIDDLEPDMFHKLLRFIYGGDVPGDIALKKEAKAIIRAASRFGCTGLKHAAEAKLASESITTENAAEMIVFADSTNCALLKEAALDYFVNNAESIMASAGYELVKESPAIMGEMMAAMATASKKRPATPGGDGKDYKRMRVATLRKKLDAKGLDIDGSKEELTNRLQYAETESEAAEALSQIHRSAITP